MTKYEEGMRARLKAQRDAATDPVERETYALAERAGFDWFDTESAARSMAEHAAGEIVALRNSRDELLAACKAQHQAIDVLFARLIVLSRDHTPETPFFPSKSGQTWDAAVAGNAAIARAQGRQ